MEWSASPGSGGGGGAGAGRGGAAATGDGDGEVWLSLKKRNNGLGCMAYPVTAKSPEASSRSSQKMNGSRYKGVLLLLSIQSKSCGELLPFCGFSIR